MSQEIEPDHLTHDPINRMSILQTFLNKLLSSQLQNWEAFSLSDSKIIQNSL